MNLATELEYTIDKIQELDDLFKEKVPSVSSVIETSKPLMDKIKQLKVVLEDNIPTAIKQAVDLAWVANAKDLSSRDVLETDKINLLSKFYFKEAGLSEDEKSELITYSNRIAKANTLMAQATDIRVKMVNEITRILGNLTEFDQQENENGRHTIQINYEKLFDVSPENKELLRQLSRLILDQHDSRSSSFTKPEDRARDEMINEIRAELGKQGLLQKFEPIMYLNKFLNDHTILNNLYSLENIIKENPAIYELEKAEGLLRKPTAVSKTETDKYFGLSDNGILLYLGKHEYMDGAEDRATEIGENIIFFIGETEAQDWREQLPRMSDNNNAVGVTDTQLLFGLGQPNSMEEADLEFQRGLDGYPNDNYAWISDLDGKQMKQWMKVLEMSLYNKASKSIKVSVAKGSGDYDTDGAYGPIIEDNLEADNIGDIVDFMQEFVLYHEIDEDNYVDGTISVDGKEFTTIDWNLLKFKEIFKPTKGNRTANTGDDIKALEFLSKTFNGNNSGEKDMAVAQRIYTVCYGDANCLEKLSTVFHNGAKGIVANEAISFDLTVLSAYFGDVTAAHNVTRRIKRGSKASTELGYVIEALGDLDDFNNWMEDKDNIEVKAVNKTVRNIGNVFTK